MRSMLVLAWLYGVRAVRMRPLENPRNSQPGSMLLAGNDNDEMNQNNNPPPQHPPPHTGPSSPLIELLHIHAQIQSSSTSLRTEQLRLQKVNINAMRSQQ